MLQSRREASKRKGRLTVLAATKRLFKEKGYENTIIEDVAIAANVSKATVYNYFTSKEGLLMGLVEEEVTQIIDNIKSIDFALNGYEKICRLIELQLLENRHYLEISRRMILMKACADNSTSERFNHIIAVVKAYVEEAKEQGVFRQDISTEAIIALLNSFYLYAQFSWNGLEDLTDSECIKQIRDRLDLITAGCRATSGE